MDVTAKVRRWGDSLGVVIPREIAVEENLIEGDTIVISVEKEADLSDFFGAFQHKQKNTQKFKDELREIWSK